MTIPARLMSCYSHHICCVYLSMFNYKVQVQKNEKKKSNTIYMVLNFLIVHLHCIQLGILVVCVFCIVFSAVYGCSGVELAWSVSSCRFIVCSSVYWSSGVEANWPVTVDMSGCTGSGSVYGWFSVRSGSV